MSEECNYSHSHSRALSELSPTGVVAPHRPAVVSPCAACKILRRRCTDKCMLAPYFPPTDPLKFIVAHRVFGASNIIKLLQELPESYRADAVTSMVYEANARLRDPVYGCAGTICQLQEQISVLQVELAKANATKIAKRQEQKSITPLKEPVCFHKNNRPKTATSTKWWKNQGTKAKNSQFSTSPYITADCIHPPLQSRFKIDPSTLILSSLILFNSGSFSDNCAVSEHPICVVADNPICVAADLPLRVIADRALNSSNLG
ncbi:hypothetical protein E3N88_38284 [Mikania micrantha]|uniref:LOB domain-containing protein n=1 Tax=Mikania micrantha TaxID=192012 RepID=A0A5N6LTM1_9ASTR|nr:hypothetical protein E3N88_38284 [Mikania micrantha]